MSAYDPKRTCTRTFAPQSATLSKHNGVVLASGHGFVSGRRFPKACSGWSARAYAFAIFCFAVAAVVRWMIGIWFEGVVPFATFFPATLLAALVGGIGPGVLVAVLGGIIGWWAFFDPPMAFFPLTTAQLISVIAYFITS
jgi:K+-sensing histidine kinase KdpD